ncbi:MAG: TetR/AcrR family transcriptional regulator, partial [Acidobacteria bacterium]|nr:TetR/AcrR family transcriptional regulator [Acidobacteriota bacterium]
MSRQATRERLVQAAADLFYEGGIHQTGVNQVIERAGLSKPTLYQHFRSKNDLVLAVLKRWAERREELLGEILADEHRPPCDRLIATFQFFEDWFRQRDFRGCGLVNAATEIPSRDDPG